MAAGGSNSRGGRRAGRAANGKASPETLLFTIPSDHDAQLVAMGEILHHVEQAGFTGREFFGIKLALEEALMNAIRHGNRLDPKKNVHIEARFHSGQVEFLIEDEGPGFDRGCVPDPTADENLEKCSGRGILLMESYMSRVWWDRGGRRLRMIKEHLESR